MVDVSAKEVTAREAVARGRIRISPAAMRLVRAGRLRKGGVTEGPTARSGSSGSSTFRRLLNQACRYLG